MFERAVVREGSCPSVQNGRADVRDGKCPGGQVSVIQVAHGPYSMHLEIISAAKNALRNLRYRVR